MSNAEEVNSPKLPLKAMINKEKNKVLFVEADSQFVDILFSFLTLPLAKIVKILENHYGEKAPVFGSLTTLCKGVKNLDSISVKQRSYLLNPTNSSEPQCFSLRRHGEGSDGKRKRSVVAEASGNKASRTQTVVDDGNVTGNGDSYVFASNTASFVISDDLRVAPVVPGAVLQALMNVGISDTDGAERRTVVFGGNEIRDLLRACLISETPLTDIILGKRISKTLGIKGDLLHQMNKQLLVSNPRKMTLKAMVQKSTNKVVIAQSEEDFIDFLLSFLTIPLGAVECVLGSKTCLKNIDNLYWSIAVLIDDKFFKTKEAKTMLIRPKPLNMSYTSQNPSHFVVEGLSPYHRSLFTIARDQGSYGKGSLVYNVTDDLTVSPFSLTSFVEFLNRMKIPLSDVKEVNLHVGVEEALSILKASLTSTFALTSGLVNLILNRQPKQEC